MLLILAGCISITALAHEGSSDGDRLTSSSEQSHLADGLATAAQNQHSLVAVGNGGDVEAPRSDAGCTAPGDRERDELGARHDVGIVADRDPGDAHDAGACLRARTEVVDADLQSDDDGGLVHSLPAGDHGGMAPSAGRERVDGATPSPVAAAPVLPPAPASGADVRALVCSYDWDCETALAVAHCESRFDANATGSAGERGWFQIHPVHAGSFDWSRAYEPEVNVAYAYRLWRDQGWRPWACARGAY